MFSIFFLSLRGQETQMQKSGRPFFVVVFFFKMYQKGPPWPRGALGGPISPYVPLFSVLFPPCGAPYFSFYAAALWGAPRTGTLMFFCSQWQNQKLRNGKNKNSHSHSHSQAQGCHLLSQAQGCHQLSQAQGCHLRSQARWQQQQQWWQQQELWRQQEHWRHQL